MKTFLEFINENFQNIYDKILDNDELSEFLNYLVHDKSHVIDNKSKSLELEEVLDLVKGTTYNFPLYRGLYDEQLEDFKIGEIYKFKRYQSFSENLELAKSFSQNNLILQANSSVNGFNYGRYQIHSWEKLKKNDPESYELGDGDDAIEFALEEAEWIFPRNSSFIVNDIGKKDDYIIIIGNII